MMNARLPTVAVDNPGEKLAQARDGMVGHGVRVRCAVAFAAAAIRGGATGKGSGRDAIRASFEKLFDLNEMFKKVRMVFEF